jgi:hypothetical protein
VRGAATSNNERETSADMLANRKNKAIVISEVFEPYGSRT